MHAAVEDAGRYTCVVTNSAGEERKSFDLDILGKEILNDVIFFIDSCPLRIHKMSVRSEKTQLHSH